MRKRIFAILLVMLTAFTLSAGFHYGFDILSFDPVHDVYLANQNSPNLGFNYIVNYEGYPDHIWQDGRIYELKDKFRAKPGMAEVKVGETISFGRNIFTFDSFLSPIKWDILAVQGLVSIVFDGEISDLMGYDGNYFVGTALSIADRFSLRFGMSHWCTHYGDAIIKNLQDFDKESFDSNYKYLRNNLTIGISVEPLSWLRLYGEYQWLPKGMYLNPKHFRPDHAENGDEVGWGDSYKASIVDVGVELSYPIWKKLGNSTIAYDLTLYEEGKIIYRDGDEYLKWPSDFSNIQTGDIYYDSKAPWIMEHSIVMNQEFNSYFSLEIGWHSGRSPLNGLFFITDNQWVHIGMRFDPDLTCHTVL